jgi:WD40 repeat protein
MFDGVVWMLKGDDNTLQPLTIDGGSYGSVAFSSDGKLAVSSQESGTIRLLDAGAGKEIRRWQGPLGQSLLTFSPDGKILAMAPSGWSAPVTILRWDTATGKELEQPSGHLEPCDVIGFSRDSKALFSSDRSKVIEWDLDASRVRRELFSAPLSPAGKLLVCQSFSSDGKRVAANEYMSPIGYRAGVEKESEFYVWDTMSGTLHRTFKWSSPAGATKLSPDGRFLISQHDDGIRLWEVETTKVLHHWPNTRISAFSSDSRTLAYIGGSQESKTFWIHIWDIVANKEVVAWDTGWNQLVPYVVLSPDSKLLANWARTDDFGQDIISIWSTATGKEVTQLKIDGEISTISFSPSGRLLAVALAGRSKVLVNKVGLTSLIELWEVPSSQKVRRIESPHGIVQALTFSPDGRKLATAGEDSTELVWSLPDLLQASGSEKGPLTKAQLEGLWSDLSSDAPRAYKAIWTMALQPNQTLPFLKERWQVKSAPEEQIAKLIADLDSDQFPVRQTAAKNLDSLGEAVEATLRKVLEKKLTLEVRQRVEQILRNRDERAIQKLRGIEVLEQINTAEASDLLLSLANGSPNPRVTDAASAALRRLANRQK